MTFSCNALKLRFFRIGEATEAMIVRKLGTNRDQGCSSYFRLCIFCFFISRRVNHVASMYKSEILTLSYH